MNIRCFIGLHKWTDLNEVYWDMVAGVTFVERKLGCLRCGKTKVVRRRADSE